MRGLFVCFCFLDEKQETEIVSITRTVSETFHHNHNKMHFHSETTEPQKMNLYQNLKTAMWGRKGENAIARIAEGFCKLLGKNIYVLVGQA